ncbi:hypothetical protein [Burkholderia lata]|nr:hypothetical protein [Burkholderia lata]
MSLTLRTTFPVAAVPVDGAFDAQCDTRDRWQTTSGIASER